MSLAIQINSRSSVPKYRQIANSIISGIENKLIRKEDQLPSINELSAGYNISRDTAEKAYRLLKKKGVIRSVRGKGYYAASDSLISERRILLVFNKLSLYKEAIYNSFVRTIGQDAWVDLQVYYEDIGLFERIVREKAGQFTDYVILPSFRGENAVRAQQIIDRHLTGKRLLLLNATLPGIETRHRAVVQNFEEDIYLALGQALPKLARYQRLKLYFPFDCNYCRGIIRGFQRFSLQHQLDSQIIFKNYATDPIESGTAFVVIKDEQLVTLVDRLKQRHLTPGREVGILAYNDSPFKQVLLDGISVMTTNHDRMGTLAARQVLDNDWRVIENEFRLIERGSL